MPRSYQVSIGTLYLSITGIMLATLWAMLTIR